jgi:membrane protein implicated in regulation of membrane protease activity
MSKAEWARIVAAALACGGVLTCIGIVVSSWHVWWGVFITIPVAFGCFHLFGRYLRHLFRRYTRRVDERSDEAYTRAIEAAMERHPSGQQISETPHLTALRRAQARWHR